MGLGKTLQASDAAERRGSTDVFPSIIVCPSTLVGHWAFEIDKYIDLSLLSVLQYVGSAQDRVSLREQFNNHNVIITSYFISDRPSPIIRRYPRCRHLRRNETMSYAAATTRVFWDMEDFPVPQGGDLYDFPKKIGRALRIEGYTGEVSIWVYAGIIPDVVEAQCRYMGMWVAEPADEKCTRLQRMFLDMIEWAIMNPASETKRELNLMVISKDIPGEDTEFFSVLKDLKRRHYNVFLAVPDDCPSPPPTPSLVWRWTDLFNGRTPIESDSDSDEEGSSQQGEKRTKTDSEN